MVRIAHNWEDPDGTSKEIALVIDESGMTIEKTEEGVHLKVHFDQLEAQALFEAMAWALPKFKHRG